jgi:type I restriction enzyme R subunit
VKEPAQMKLLIVVDMLLTGFDAPSATYLYIDKPMKDHSLFQAVCRVNRIDTSGEDKTHGYIVDYRSLFSMLKDSVIDYTKGAFENYDLNDLAGILKPIGPDNRSALDDLVEATNRLLLPIADSTKTEEILKYFVTESLDSELVATHERLRVEYYKQVSATIRAYSSLSGREDDAGYSEQEFAAVKIKIDHFVKIKDEVAVASGDYIDLQLYEPDMRKLIDTYIKSNRSRVVADLSNRPLLELLVSEGGKAIDGLPEGIKENPAAVAETVVNNIRRAIVEKAPTNPKYFDKLSALLAEVIKQSEDEAADYAQLLKTLLALADDVLAPKHDYPLEISRLGLSAGAIYDQLDHNIEMTQFADQVLMEAQDGWRHNQRKIREVRNALLVGVKDPVLVDRIIEVAKHYDNY